jgi:release factor glutamine methyltransferase
MGESWPGLRAATLREAFTAGAALLRGHGAATPELDAKLLLLAATGLSQEAYIRDPSRILDWTETVRLSAYLMRRAEGEPVSKILGIREFYGRDFVVSPDTLDPRPDSETLIEAALKLAAGRTGALRLLDLGTGSGCLLLTLLAELPEAEGLGVDLSAAALRIAEQNANRLGLIGRVRFLHGDWLEPVEGRFDIIVANPPYIPTGEVAGLAPEVREHDPALALDGGADGLDAYRRIAGGLAPILNEEGVALFEVGGGQAEPVLALLRDAGLHPLEEGSVFQDLAGISRCVAAGKESAAVRRRGAGD